MEPQPALNLMPTIQQAIANLLTTYEPEFLRVRLTALPVVRDDPASSWQGIRMMFSQRRRSATRCSTSRSCCCSSRSATR